jgi:hypothetical protein
VVLTNVETTACKHNDRGSKSRGSLHICRDGVLGLKLIRNASTKQEFSV